MFYSAGSGEKKMHETEKRPLIHLPHIGKRTVKTIVSATLVAFVYGILGFNPCFACIGAVYGMGSTFRGGLQSGGNRFLGTVIGGLFAIPFYWLTHLSDWPVPNWIWLGLGCFCVLYVSQMFGALGAIQPGTVVFFVVLATVSPDRYISYTLARILDTCIGVLVSLGISKLFPSPQETAELNRRAAEALEMAQEAEDGEPDCGCGELPAPPPREQPVEKTPVAAAQGTAAPVAAPPEAAPAADMDAPPKTASAAAAPTGAAPAADVVIPPEPALSGTVSAAQER